MYTGNFLHRMTYILKYFGNIFYCHVCLIHLWTRHSILFLRNKSLWPMISCFYKIGQALLRFVCLFIIFCLVFFFGMIFFILPISRNLLWRHLKCSFHRAYRNQFIVNSHELVEKKYNIFFCDKNNPTKVNFWNSNFTQYHVF